jgi:DNA-binding NarL/FixJ family response regulator
MPSADTSSDDQRIKQWARVLAARAEYLLFSEELEGIILRQDEFGGDGLQQDDSLQLLSSLGRQRAAALEKYKRALAAYWNCLPAKTSPDPNPSTPGELTPREQEVLILIASGKTSKEIAERLGIRLKTTACHRTRIMVKLNAHKSADLARAAIRMGLIEP